jgi:hypothetical protein
MMLWSSLVVHQPAPANVSWNPAPQELPDEKPAVLCNWRVNKKLSRETKSYDGGARAM